MPIVAGFRLRKLSVARHQRRTRLRKQKGRERIETDRRGEEWSGEDGSEAYCKGTVFST